MFLKEAILHQSGLSKDHFVNKISITKNVLIVYLLENDSNKGLTRYCSVLRDNLTKGGISLPKTKRILFIPKQYSLKILFYKVCLHKMLF